MVNELFFYLSLLEDFLWDYIGFPIVVLFGLYLTFKSRAVQLRKLPKSCLIFLGFFKKREAGEGVVHPIKAFFASVGGCVGIGNVVAICTAIQLGGPGALFWVWVTATIGVLIKYGEVYLGMRYRIPDKRGGFLGGPMYFLDKAFSGSWASKIFCFLLCIYGVEVLQFDVVATSISANYEVNLYIVIALLLALVLFAGSGGVKRVANISTAIIPVFVVIYAAMGGWVLWQNLYSLPGIISDVVGSAFTGHAAIGGFAGSSLLLTISQGVRRGCYTGDIGVGYASIIYSESGETDFTKLASLVFLGVVIDTFIVCTTTVMLVLATGVWMTPMDPTMMVQMSLGQYFPFMEFFMPFFLFLLGYTTIYAYFCVGLKCAEFLSAKWGKGLFYCYAIVAFVAFSLVDTIQAQIAMTVVSALLLILNSWGIWRLRREISFVIEP